MVPPKTIAVGFDGTLCENRYPEIGIGNMRLIEMLKSEQQRGNKVILFTNRTVDSLETAVKWCRLHGLIFDAVHGGGSRKAVDYDLRIDYQAIHPVALEQWNLRQVLQSLENPKIRWGWKYEPMEEAFPNGAD